MSTARTIRLLTAALLVTVGLLAAPAGPVSADAAPQKPPKYTAYEYRATFTAEVTHHVELQYYDERDGRFVDASASLSGRIPSVVLTRVDGSTYVSMDAARSTVRALSGAVDSTTTTDEGRTEVRCEGDSIWKTDKQHPFMIPDARKRQHFHAFAVLSLPQTCRDNQGGEPTTSVHSLPELPAPMRMSPARFGDRHITIPFSAERTYPKAAGETKECPGSADSLTVACSYRVKGTIELTRVRVY